MFQWWKKRRLEHKNRLEAKLNEEIDFLNDALEKQIMLYEINTKQYNDFMVESKQCVNKFRELLQEEKQSNGKLLESRVKQIGELKKEITGLRREKVVLEDNNTLLKNTLGHF